MHKQRLEPAVTCCDLLCTYTAVYSNSVVIFNSCAKKETCRVISSCSRYFCGGRWCVFDGDGEAGGRDEGMVNGGFLCILLQRRLQILHVHRARLHAQGRCNIVAAKGRGERRTNERKNITGHKCYCCNDRTRYQTSQEELFIVKTSYL